ncbi:hydroxycarboxylic acid receptor 2-like [Onychostoma macrolepis]|uniref:hydroxycarboxylic acid receptor 2-like n=1 Tax=Onychostoma macrolepis TaxID=369639 RepID=UPI00272B7431|nr:hydroxycarboxylic acid receptor 2-like [Onychostoma macrolepis]
MNNSTGNFTTPETSTNTTSHSLGLVDYLEICVYSISFLFGLPAHSFVLWLIVTRTASGVASEFFSLNLSVCELGICLNGLVLVLSMWFASLSTFELFLVGFSMAGRPLFQCLICVERYLAVVHPVTFLKYKPLRYRVICCTVVWTITLGSCLLCFFLGSQSRYIYTWLSSVQMILVLSVQLFCLVAVLRALKQSGPGEKTREKEEENHMKRRAFHIILITTMTTVIMYVPNTMTGFIEILTRDSTPTVWFTGSTCFVLAGFVQPFLHLHRAGKLSCFCSS